MALDLHPNNRSCLEELLKDGLPKIITKNGMFLDDSSVIEALVQVDQSLPQNGKLREKLIGYIGKFPLFQFVRDSIARDLYINNVINNDQEKIRLVELSGYRDVSAVSNRLLNEFESLPWSYVLTTALPQRLSDHFPIAKDEWPLSKNVRLVRANQEFSLQYPMDYDEPDVQKLLHPRGIAAALAEFYGPAPSWAENSMYIQIDVEGFIDLYGGTTPAIEAELLLRSFYGLGLAIRLFDIKPTFSSGNPFGGTLGLDVFVHRKEDRHYKIMEKYQIADHHSSNIRDLKFHDHDGRLEEGGALEIWLNQSLSKIASVMKSGENAENIRRAARWFFDGYGSKDEKLGYIQTVIVLEILLGDKSTSDVIGLGQLLGNRCAYLISKTQRERDDIISTFRKIYEVRSNIVHSGQDRLTSDQRVLFGKLRWICRRVIQEEIKLLEAD